MELAYDGRQVVEMDLHRRRSVLVRMTEDGRRLGTARITRPEPCRMRCPARLRTDSQVRDRRSPQASRVAHRGKFSQARSAVRTCR